MLFRIYPYRIPICVRGSAANLDAAILSRVRPCPYEFMVLISLRGICAGRFESLIIFLVPGTAGPVYAYLGKLIISLKTEGLVPLKVAMVFRIAGNSDMVSQLSTCGRGMLRNRRIDTDNIPVGNSFISFKEI